jgi:hypothetical protein
MKNNLRAIVACSISAVMLVVVLVPILIILKRKGIICARKQRSSTINPTPNGGQNHESYSDENLQHEAIVIDLERIHRRKRLSSDENRRASLQKLI